MKDNYKHNVMAVVFIVFLIIISAISKSEVKQERGSNMEQKKSGVFTLPSLPYDQNALEPVISAKTLSFHYGKHHQGYLNKLNELIAGTEFENLTLEEIILKTAGQPDKTAVFNNAAQVWNHTFYWNCLSPKGGGIPSGEIGKKIEADFGSYDNFVKQFVDAGMAQFGSGWAWLVEDEGVLKIVKTPNGENPMSQKKGKAILVLDVWEHAYYLDYQNRRNDHLKTVVEKLINWDFAQKNLTSGKSD